MTTDTHRVIVVLLGTDHHPFDRLCGWADEWVQRAPGDEVIVQHGFTKAPRLAVGVEMFTPQELEVTLDRADAAVTHGGPGTISTVRSRGLTPVIVPRDPARGEHVDAHQLRFAVWAAEHGLGTLIKDVARLDDAVTLALDAGRSVNLDQRIEQSVAAVSDVFASLSGPHSSRARIPRIRPRRTR